MVATSLVLPTVVNGQGDTLLYRAAVAAAEGAIGAGDTRNARRWLDAAPVAPRGFEWRYLDGVIRRSTSAFVVSAHPIRAIAVAPEGTAFATGTADGWVEERTLATGEMRRRQRHGATEIYAVAFSPDGTLLASAGADGWIRLWSRSSGSQVDSLGSERRRPLDIAFDASGKRLAASLTAGAVAVWDLPSRRLLHLLTGHVARPPVPGVAFLADGRVASGSWDQHVKVWNTETGTVERTLGPGYEHSGPYSAWSAVDADRSGTFVAASGRDGLHLWSLSDWSERVIRGTAADVPAIAFSPDGSMVLTGSTDQRLDVWNVRTGLLVASLRGHTGTVRGVAWSPDGRTAVSASDDGMVRVWDTEAARRSALEFPSAPYVASWDSAGRRLAVGLHTGRVHLLDGATGRVVRDDSISTRPIIGVVFAPSDDRLIAMVQDGPLRIWEPGKPDEGQFIGEPGYRASLMAMTDDGRRLTTIGGDRTIRSWLVASREAGPTLTLPTGVSARSIAMVGNSDTVIVGLADGSALAADLNRGRILSRSAVMQGPVSAVLWHRDRRIAWLATDAGSIWQWDLRDGGQGRTIRAHDDRIISLTRSPDGSRVVSTSYDQTVRLWDTNDLSLLLTVRGFANYTHCAAFTPSGNRLAVCSSAERVVRLYEARPD